MLSTTCSRTLQQNLTAFNSYQCLVVRDAIVRAYLRSRRWGRGRSGLAGRVSGLNEGPVDVRLDSCAGGSIRLSSAPTGTATGRPTRPCRAAGPRTEASLSQSDHVKRISTTQSVISRTEEGEGARNRHDTLASVAAALDRHLVVSFPEKVVRPPEGRGSGRLSRTAPNGTECRDEVAYGLCFQSHRRQRPRYVVDRSTTGTYETDATDSERTNSQETGPMRTQRTRFVTLPR